MGWFNDTCQRVKLGVKQGSYRSGEPLRHPKASQSLGTQESPGRFAIEELPGILRRLTFAIRQPSIR
jgi:hypothetical protein